MVVNCYMVVNTWYIRKSIRGSKIITICQMVAKLLRVVKPSRGNTMKKLRLL